MFRNMRLFGSSIFFSLILEKWNCNGQRRKQLKARVALFFLRLFTCDQQTKWVREGFRNTSDGFPHSTRWGFRIFYTKRDFDSFSQFVASVAATTGSSLSSAWSSLHPKPTWQFRLAWDTCFCATPLIPSAPLAHTQTFPGDGHPTTLGGRQARGKDLLMSVRSMGTAEPKSKMGCTQAKLPNGLGMVRTLNDADLCKLHVWRKPGWKSQQEVVRKYLLFFFPSEWANYLPVSSLCWWTVRACMLVGHKSRSGAVFCAFWHRHTHLTHSLIFFIYRNNCYSGRGKTRYCLWMLSLNKAHRW